MFFENPLKSRSDHSLPALALVPDFWCTFSFNLPINQSSIWKWGNWDWEKLRDILRIIKAVSNVGASPRGLLINKEKEQSKAKYLLYSWWRPGWGLAECLSQVGLVTEPLKWADPLPSGQHQWPRAGSPLTEVCLGEQKGDVCPLWPSSGPWEWKLDLRGAFLATFPKSTT